MAAQAIPRPYPVINPSGIHLRSSKHLSALRRGRFILPDVNVAGDAPKDFIRIYEYGVGRRNSPRSWPGYIAKVGHKWYPNESITEHLLTRIGQLLDLRIAESRLMWFGPLLRFLSRYFLENPDEQLVHGAEIFAGFLQD